MTTRAFLDAIGKALDLKPGALSLDDTPETVEQWDSLGHLAIIAAVEWELHVDTNAEEFQTFGSMRELVTTLKSKGLIEE